MRVSNAITTLGLLALGTSATPQRRQEECNAAEFHAGPFQLAAYDPVISTSTALTIGVVSRGVNVIWPTPNANLTDDQTFTFDDETGRLRAAGAGDSDELTDGSPLTFAVNWPVAPGRLLVQRAGGGCWHGRQSGVFVVPRDDDDDDATPTDDDGAGVDVLDLAGWNMCGQAGLTWTGDEAPAAGCTKVGMHVLTLD